jgi:hypothetical protein
MKYIKLLIIQHIINLVFSINNKGNISQLIEIFDNDNINNSNSFTSSEGILFSGLTFPTKNIYKHWEENELKMDVIFTLINRKKIF